MSFLSEICLLFFGAGFFLGSFFHFGSLQFIGILFQHVQDLFPTMPRISAPPVTKLIHCAFVQAEDIHRPNRIMRIHLYLFWQFLQQHIDFQPHLYDFFLFLWVNLDPLLLGGDPQFIEIQPGVYFHRIEPHLRGFLCDMLVLYLSERKPQRSPPSTCKPCQAFCHAHYPLLSSE